MEVHCLLALTPEFRCDVLPFMLVVSFVFWTEVEVRLFFGVTSCTTTALRSI